MSSHKRTSLARDWYIGELEGMERKPNHSTRELNGIKIGRKKRGMIRYSLRNKKEESLQLEILHLLHNREFFLKKGKSIEALQNGYELLRKWREKGIVSSEGDIRDIKVDLLLAGDELRI